MATKLFRALKLLLLLLIPVAAHATTYNISAGASLATIQSTITTAGQASGSNTVQFAAGTSNIAWGSGGRQINIPCPSGSLTITGPNTTYDQPGILNAWAARPTATIRNTNSGESVNLFGFPGGCQNQITFQYLEVDGNRPQSGGGAIYIGAGGAGPSAATSNITIQYNWLHGNQEIVPVTCGAGVPWCYNDTSGAAAEIWLDGSHGDTSNNGTYVNNINIVHNVFGNGTPSNVDAGDCGHVMEFIGGCTTTAAACDWLGYDQDAGYCTALGVHTDIINFHFDYNKIIQEEQGAKFFEGGSPYNGDGQFSVFFQVNSTMNYNNIGIYHRIGTEDQASSINYVGGFSANTDCAGSGSPNGNDCMTHVGNIMHDNYNPSFGNWGFSLANTGYRADNGNVMITNDNNGGGAGPGDFEDFATFNTVAQNLSQGYMGCAIQYGGDNNIALFHAGNLNNNQFQDINGAACGGSTQISFAINNAHGGAPQTNTGNTGTATVSKVNSVAPTFSPNGGSFGGSVVVTLNDTGLTSGAGPRGNTNLWCTTDNSTPAPASGTSVYYPAGGTITLTSTTTLKCVGMWGTQNEVTDIPSGYGYNPSSPVTAVFTGGGTPTAAVPTFTPGSENITGATSVTLASSTPSSTILYCLLSGCTPTTVYSSPISVSSTTTISAISTAAGFANSGIGQATYTLVAPGQAVTPVFSPAAPLTFTTPISVSITSSTPSNTIYYTTNGTTPTTSSTVYTGPITVSATQTLKAIAAASGFTNSAVGSATYTFSLFLGNNLQDNSSSNTYPGAFNGIYAVTGTSAGGYTVTGCTIDQGTAAVTNGKHTACVLSAATSPTTIATNSLCSGFYTNTSTSGTVAQITMTGCPTLAASTPYVISTITDDPLMPSALGFNDCGSTCTGGVPTLGVGTQASFYFGGTYGIYTGMTTTMNKGVDQLTAYLTLTPATTTTATPVISPTSGTITGATTISIADTTPSSTIYYTTDGSTPAVPVTSTNIDTSLTNWSTCVIGTCAGTPPGSPGGTGTPTAYSQTINNSSPSGAPSGVSMLLSQTANVSNTNALWTYKSPTKCDACTALNSSFSIQLGSNSAQASQFEFDNFNFSVTANKNYMAGHQYNQVTGKWQVFNGATQSWVDTSVTTFISYSAWHTLAFSDTVTSCSGTPGIMFNSVTIDGTVHAINLCEPAATLPGNFASTVGTQFQINIGTITGSQTVVEDIDNVVFTAQGATTSVYTAPFSISATTTVQATATAAGMTNSAVASNIYTLSTGSISQLKLLTKSGVNYVIPGSNDQVTIQITYSDGFVTTLNAVGNQDVRNTVVTSWTSSNVNVATINSTGSIVGVSNSVIPNTTIITAVVTDVGGTTHTVTLLEGVAFTLTAGIE